MFAISKFRSADEYIKAVLMERKNVNKYTLIKHAEKNGLTVHSSDAKEQLIDIIADNLSLRAIAAEQQIGVASVTMQRKFHVDNEIVRFLARTGLFHIVGTEPFIDKAGNQHQANVYDAYDYFELTPSDVVRYLYSLAVKNGK